MSKYIGTPVVNVSVDTVDVTGDITTTDTTPEVIIVNNTHEDTDGGREGKLTFKGQASGGEETTLAQIQASHDGTSDDEKGDLIFKTNDGSDGASPTERLRLDSGGRASFSNGSIVTIGNSTMGGIAGKVPDTEDFTLAVVGTGFLDSSVTLQRFENSSSGPALLLGHSRNGTIGSSTILQDGDELGKIRFFADDGTNMDHHGGEIKVLIDGTPGANDIPSSMVFSTAADGGNSVSERMRIASDGKVGIGTASPTANLHVSSGTSGDAVVLIEADTDNNDEDDTPILRLSQDGGATITDIGIEGTAGTLFTNSLANATYINTTGSTPIQFATNDTARMTITNTGDLGVATTTAVANTNSEQGLWYQADDYLAISRDGNPFYSNLVGGNTSGTFMQGRRDGVTGCNLGVRDGAAIEEFWIGNGGNIGLRSEQSGADRIEPCRGSNGNAIDNTISLGSTGVRFDDIYATNGTIQTSDRNLKQDIKDLSEAEKRVAIAAKGLIKKYRWIDSVQEKGDNARIHIGIIAQDLQAAFEAEGLDASRYAMFISTTWWEADRVVLAIEANEAEGIEAVAEHTVTDHYYTEEEAPEGATERTRLGVRYPELLAFIIGAM